MNKYLLISMLISILVWSCREPVDYPFSDIKPMPVINSILEANSNFTVHISMSKRIDTSRVDVIDNAIVKLFVNNQYSEIVTYVGNGLYRSNQVVSINNEYKCEIEIPDYEVITCAAKIPVTVPFFDLKHISIAGKDQEGMTYPAIEFSFRNDTAVRCYYEAVIKLEKHGFQFAESGEITDPLLLNEGLPVFLFSNEQIKDTIYRMRLNYLTNSGGSSGDGPTRTKLYPFVFEFRSVSYDYYLFRKSIYLYELGRYPEFGAGLAGSFSIYTNIPHALGFFGGFSSYQSDIQNP